MFLQLLHGKLVCLWRKWSSLAVSAVCVLSSSRSLAGPTLYCLVSFTLVWKDSLVFYFWQYFLIFVLPSHFLSKALSLSLYLSKSLWDWKKSIPHALVRGSTRSILLPTANLHFSLCWVIFLFMKRVLKMLLVVESSEKTDFNLAMHDIGMEQQ